MSNAVPPQAQPGRMITGYWISQAIYAAAHFGIADLLKDGPASATDLAIASGTRPQLLYRLLRALASVGIFAEETDQQFRDLLDSTGFELTSITHTSTDVSVIASKRRTECSVTGCSRHL